MYFNFLLYIIYIKIENICFLEHVKTRSTLTKKDHVIYQEANLLQLV